MSKKYPSKDDGSMKDLSGYKKIEWIWNYYKIHIIAVVVAVLMIVYYIMHLMSINRDAITLLICNVYTEDTDAADAYLNTVFDDFIQDESNGKLPLEFDHSLIYDTENDNNNYMMVQKLTAIIAARSAHMMLLDQAVVDRFGNQGIFENLQTWLPEDMYRELEERDMLQTVTIPADEDNPEYTYTAVINIGKAGSQVLSDAGYQLTENSVITIPAATNQRERTLNFLRMILDQPYVSGE